MHWYVLYTKPRNEKKVAERLEAKGMEVYCPLKETIKQWSDRKKKVKQPVFTSYIFVRLDNYEIENVAALSDPGAVRFLWWNKKPGVVRDAEIKAIKDFLNDYKGAEISVELVEGQEVMVQEGPLREHKGKVIRVSGRKVYLFIKSLGYNLTAELPVSAVNIIK